MRRCPKFRDETALLMYYALIIAAVNLFIGMSRVFVKKKYCSAMSCFTLVTGGSRSGKSAFAQKLAEGVDAPRLFLATCPRLDPEMDERIVRHRREREGRGWQTAEEPLRLTERVELAPAGSTVLIDCLTLWVSNLMHEDSQISEERIAGLTARLGRAASGHQGRVLAVTNEVGLGIVPDNPAARRFRDLAGRCNQAAAVLAEEVYFVCSGIPLRLK
jgi:adenosylcobinamide kinase/adenosylcobinamide-phosphate guanylyltransferase